MNPELSSLINDFAARFQAFLKEWEEIQKQAAQPPAAPKPPEPNTSNPCTKPDVIERNTPHKSSRNGSTIRYIVVHCTEGSLESTHNEFQSSPKKVSSHYVLDRDGKLYQYVDDDRVANHCYGANQVSLGIEIVGKATDSLSEAQVPVLCQLLEWLCHQYKLTYDKIYGHDFAPDYGRKGGTSCPNKLFGPAHTQKQVQQWVNEHLDRWGESPQVAWHEVKASSFADPNDIEAYKEARAAGMSDLEACQFGDNGVGKWGADTTGPTPMCALAPKDWAGLPNPAGTKIKVYCPKTDKMIVCELQDSPLEGFKNGAGIDLNYAAVKALGLTPPLMEPVKWAFA